LAVENLALELFCTNLARLILTRANLQINVEVAVWYVDCILSESIHHKTVVS
jgi:hypothetical protein